MSATCLLGAVPLYWLLALPLILYAAGTTGCRLRGLHRDRFQRFAGAGATGTTRRAQLRPPAADCWAAAIEGLRYQDGPLQVALTNGEFDWQPAGSVRRRALTITCSHVDGLDSALPPGKDTRRPDQPLELPDIRCCWHFTVTDLQAGNLQIPTCRRRNQSRSTP